MKKPIVIWVAVVLVVLAGALVLTLIPSKERVSLTLLRYQRVPDGAWLMLSNDTRRTITYFTHQGGGVTLSLRKTASGWTNISLALKKGTLNAGDGKPTQVYALEFPSSPLKVGVRGTCAKSGTGAGPKRGGLRRN